MSVCSRSWPPPLGTVVWVQKPQSVGFSLRTFKAPSLSPGASLAECTFLSHLLTIVGGYGLGGTPAVQWGSGRHMPVPSCGSFPLTLLLHLVANQCCIYLPPFPLVHLSRVCFRGYCLFQVNLKKTELVTSCSVLTFSDCRCSHQRAELAAEGCAVPEPTSVPCVLHSQVPGDSASQRACPTCLLARVQSTSQGCVSSDLGGVLDPPHPGGLAVGSRSADPGPRYEMAPGGNLQNAEKHEEKGPVILTPRDSSPQCHFGGFSSPM